MNKLTKALSEKLGEKVTNVDLLNSIREMASDGYQNDVPEIDGLKGINHANVPYAPFEKHGNEFLSILFNKISNTLVSYLDFDNPLAVFKTEGYDYGGIIEEIYVGLSKKKDYKVKQTDSPFRYFDSDLKVFYHDINKQLYYPKTVNTTILQRAFRNENSFDKFIDGLYKSLYAADALDEFESVKLVLKRSLSPVDYHDDLEKSTGVKTAKIKGTFIDKNSPTFMEDFAKALKARSDLFTLPSLTRFENAVGVPMVTPKDDQFLIVDAEMSAEVDLMMANAFNMNKAEVQARKIVIDEFEKITENGDFKDKKPIAFLVSRESIILDDKLKTLTSIYNPESLGTNLFLHHHYTTSFSLIQNAHVFYVDGN